MKDIKKLDKELSQKIEKVIADGDIAKSRERQSAAEKAIQQRDKFRRENNLKR